ncbi:MAG: GNAT family N-acetyltransferase [Nakamurella sp.]
MPNDDEVCQQHAERIVALDPLLPTPGPLQPAQDGRLLRAETGSAAALALARRSEVPADGEAALWGPLRNEILTLRFAGTAPAEALDIVLGQWLDSIQQDSRDDWECAASVTVPSRDTDSVIPLIRHGFSPCLVVAARPHGRSTPSVVDPVAVRPATPADLDLLTEMAIRLHAHDVQFGRVSARNGGAELQRTGTLEALAQAPGWAWLAHVDGAPAGFCLVQPPAMAGWMQAITSVGANSGYLASLFVDPTVRGGGVGAALAAAAHRRLDNAKVAVTTLHHAMPSPWSASFWARMGYRQLWTTWQRRPIPAAGPR